MAIAGFKKALFAPGATVAMVDEAMTRRAATQVYFTADATKNLWSPLVALVIEDDGVVVDPSEYTVNHLMGRVTFDAGYTINGAVQVTGSYIERVPIVTARAGSFNFSRVSIDTSTLGPNAVCRQVGRGDATGTFECLEDGGYDHDPGAGTTKFEDILEAGIPAPYEYIADPDHPRVARAWALFINVDIASDLDEPTTASLAWEGALPGTALNSYSFGDPTS